MNNQFYKLFIPPSNDYLSFWPGSTPGEFPSPLHALWPCTPQVVESTSSEDNKTAHAFHIVCIQKFPQVPCACIPDLLGGGGGGVIVRGCFW